MLRRMQFWLKGPMAKKTVTLREMARQAGVNVGTVSRALADDPAISVARKQEIQALAEKLNYRPRPFRRKQTNAIALLSFTRSNDAPEDLFQQQIIVQLDQKAQQAGLHIHLHLIPRGQDTAELPALVTEGRVDGVILAGHPSRAFCDRLAEENISLAVINDTYDRTALPSVFCDPGPCVEDLVEHLLAAGHRNIAFATNDPKYTSVARRLAAFNQAMRQTPQANAIRKTYPTATLAAGQQAVDDLFAEAGPKPTAILFANDWMAIGGLVGLSLQGLSVPNDVSIVGCDDVAPAVGVAPGLTSINLRVDRQVAAALDLIERQINDKPCQKQIHIQPELVMRDSIAPAEQSTRTNPANRPNQLTPEPVGSTAQGDLL
jgi:DNA-binding LacI/PurR family transcriptional regulator